MHPYSEPSHHIACFSVQAEAESSVMPRVLEQFAKRNIVPLQWHSSLGRGVQGRELYIDVQVEAMEPELAQRIAENLRQIVHVQLVLTAEKRLELRRAG
ncbi:MAG: hypothetical protein AB7M05_17815 [Alphaproteobacteria bacterium]